MTSRRSLIPLLAVALGVLSTPDLEAQSSGASALPPLTSGRTHEETTMSTPGLTAATSQCAEAVDPSYGTTPTSPIKVGGAPLYVADRSVKFMRMLRGPAGEPVHFKRLGSFDGPEGTILDVWLVERVGLSQHFYLDGYRTSEVQARSAGYAAPKHLSQGQQQVVPIPAVSSPRWRPPPSDSPTLRSQSTLMVQPPTASSSTTRDSSAGRRRECAQVVSRSMPRRR